jgi:hypothetical protein
MRRLLLPALAALFSTGLTAAGLVALPASAGVPRIAVAVAAARPGDARLGDSVARHHDSDLVINVDFDAYPVGTEITNQYAGVTFEYPAAGGFSFGTPGDGVVSSAAVGPPPTVVASGGHSGAQAGGLFDGGGEFGAAGTFVALSNLADTVSVYIGDQVLTGVHVELDAYDADRHLLGSDTAVTSAVGAQTLLTYSTGGSGEIAYVAIYRSDIEDHGAVIDDLTVDEPPSTAPIVGVSTTAQSYELGQGGSEQVTLDVTRLDGASGPVMLAVSGVPSGVTASLSENPVTLPDTTSSLTLSASSSTAIGNAQVSLSASAGGALSQAATVITLAVVAPLTLVVPSSISVGACSANHVTVEADVAPGLSGPVSFSVSSS